jgi:predicted metal-dependent hydrolase
MRPILVQLRLPWPDRRARPEPTPLQVTVAGRNVPVTIARHRKARRYVVRVAPDGGVRLTVPRGASIAGGLSFATRQSSWIERQLHRLRVRDAPWQTGTEILFRGEKVALALDDRVARVGSETVLLPRGAVNVRAAVEEHLCALATRELPPRCLELANQTGVRVDRVVVRNQRSRWGACSPSRTITLNWRLVQMPPSVSDYILFHELMHVRQPNHSRKFWREVASVCAWWREAERWLRRHGRDII